MHCQNCFSEIHGKVIYCPLCNLPHHEDCWKKNNSKCSGFNCKGTTVTETNVEEKVESNNQDEMISEKDIEIKPVNSDEREVKFRIARSETNKLKPVIIILVIFAVCLTLFLLTFKKSRVIVKTETSPVSILATPTATSGEIVILPDPDEVKTTTVPTTKPTEVAVSSTPVSTPTEVQPTEDAQVDNTQNEKTQEIASTYQSPVPNETVIPTPELVQNIELNNDEQEKIKTTILAWRDQKTKIFVSPDQNNHETESLLTGKALEDVQKAIKWLDDNNAYREITPRTLTFSSINKNDDGSVEVIVKINEKSDYFEKGKLLTKNSYDHTYNASYAVENINNNWVIKNIKVIK